MSPVFARGGSRLRDAPLVIWLLAALVVALVHRWLPDANWLMLHLVVLGAVTHAVLVWSFHFSQTLLRADVSPAGARNHTLRLALLALGVAAVLTGVVTTWWGVTLGGGSAVALAVGWHGIALWRMLRGSLPARFRLTVIFYLAAASFLLVGIGLGVTLAWGWPDPWHGRLLVAHAMTNVLGWLGLTAAGTLLTLWPTMLRTRIAPHAEVWTRQALPWLCASIGVAVTGALVGLSWLAALGIALYLGALVWVGRGLWEAARKRPPHEFAPASAGAAMVWLVIGLGWVGWLLATTSDWAAIGESFVWPAAALGGGFGLQLLLGALSYLLPSVLGGGPSVVRAGQRWFNAGGGFRIIATNGGLALWLLPTPSWVKVAATSLALLAAASFLPLMLLGLRASLAARRKAADAVPVRTPGGDVALPPAPRLFNSNQVIACVTALATVLAIGVGLDPSVLSVSGPSAASIAPTGKVVRVSVTSVNMRFQPSSIEVDRGDRLVVDLVNADNTTHDLVIGAAHSARIAPGAHTELDAGVIEASTEGYCSIAGHRQMGMVFEVTVRGGTATASPSALPSMDHSGPMVQPGQPAATAAPTASSAPLNVIDPTLPPLTDEKVHKLTFTVQEMALQVAPGVWQRRWTFNGRVPGPTLHGRVGDVFEITLVNDGSMGHSIDFHAGSLAPDKPMRTIQPGESLTYTFIATRAGIWMYHCSTMPMTAHIAAGMAGAVVIEPDGLPAVDRSYVIVQSEVYLQTKATTPDAATEVNADAVSAENPTYVTFNGIANGYDQQPLTAKVGERVRFWVLDVGPNRSSSFHVVGGQFDTVYLEGSYLLKDGKDAFGDAGGGSQALGLQPAQGGFVEAVFPEAGHYPMVSHVMVDAERGAHGIVEVTDKGQ